MLETHYKDTLVIDKGILRPSEMVDITYRIVKAADQHINNSSTTIEFSNDEYIPKEKDKIFFYPGCNVPRHKVREWAKDKNISVTIKPEKATVKFASIKSLESLLSEERSFSTYNKQDLLTWFISNGYSGKHWFKNFSDTLKNVESDTVYITNMGGDYQVEGRYGRSIYPELTSGLSSIRKSGWQYLNYITPVNWNKLDDLLNSKIVFSEKKILSLIAEDSAVISEEMYKNMRRMLKSTSREDRVMSVEIMANCNYKESLHFILLLCREFPYEILQLKESKHVNFKSLIKFLDVGDIRYLSDDSMLECLMKKDKLTMNILKELCEGVKNMMSRRSDSKYFKVHSITVSDEVKEYFNKKATQQIVEEV